MWITCETLCEIIGGIEEDPHIIIKDHTDKYKALDDVVRIMAQEMSRDDLGTLCYSKYDSEKMMAKICFEQTVIVIFASDVGDKTKG